MKGTGWLNNVKQLMFQMKRKNIMDSVPLDKRITLKLKLMTFLQKWPSWKKFHIVSAKPKRNRCWKSQQLS